MKPVLNNTDLCTEITKALEAGVDRGLNSSIKYSPLKLFINFFRKSNFKLMEQVRNIVRDDVYYNLMDIDAMDFALFVSHEGGFTKQGKRLLQISFNIGIHVITKKVTVRTGFKLVTNADFREQIYYFVLEAVHRSAYKILIANLPPQQRQDKNPLSQ